MERAQARLRQKRKVDGAGQDTEKQSQRERIQDFAKVQRQILERSLEQRKSKARRPSGAPLAVEPDPVLQAAQAAEREAAADAARKRVAVRRKEEREAVRWREAPENVPAARYSILL
jgi:hypothetical protein